MRIILIIAIFLVLLNSVHAETLNVNLNIEDPCSSNLTILTNKEVYAPKEQIVFYNNLSKKIKDFQIKYYISDQNNTIIKQPTITANLNEKHYTPKETKETQLLIIKSELIQSNCPIIFAEKTITVNGNPDYIKKTTPESSIKNTKNINTTNPEIKTTITTQSQPLKQPYQITTINQSAKLLNGNSNKTTTETLFVSGQEKSRIIAPFLAIIAIILLIIGIKFKKKNGNQNTCNN